MARTTPSHQGGIVAARAKFLSLSEACVCKNVEQIGYRLKLVVPRKVWSPLAGFQRDQKTPPCSAQRNNNHSGKSLATDGMLGGFIFFITDFVLEDLIRLIPWDTSSQFSFWHISARFDTNQPRVPWMCQKRISFSDHVMVSCVKKVFVYGLMCQKWAPADF